MLFIFLIQFSVLENVKIRLGKISQIKKRHLPSHSYQTYEIFNLNSNMLIFFIQFTMLENVNSGLE